MRRVLGLIEVWWQLGRELPQGIEQNCACMESLRHVGCVDDSPLVGRMRMMNLWLVRGLCSCKEVEGKGSDCVLWTRCLGPCAYLLPLQIVHER